VSANHVPLGIDLWNFGALIATVNQHADVINTLSPSAGLVYNVKDQGAVGDGSHDDTGAINTAITLASAAGGGTVFFPNGTYLVFVQGSSQRCIEMANGVVILGASTTGVIIKLADGQTTVAGAGVRVFHSAGKTDLGLINFTIDGNLANNPDASIQSDGIFFSDLSTAGTGRVWIQGLEIKNCNGDAITCHKNSYDWVITRCYFHDNFWIGIGLGNSGGQTRILTLKNFFTNNGGGWHMEANHTTESIWVIGNYMDSPVGSAAIEVTGGPDPTTWAKNVVIAFNTCYGPVIVASAKSVLIFGNIVVSGDAAPTIPLAALKITLEGQDNYAAFNNITQLAAGTAQAAVVLAGNGSGDTATNINFVHNLIHVQNTLDGLLVQEVISSNISQNRIYCDPGVTSASSAVAGIRVYQKGGTSRVMDLCQLDDNYVASFPTGIRVDASLNNASFKITNLLVRRNAIATIAGSQTTAIGLDLNPGAAGGFPGGNNAVLALDLIDNTQAGVTTMVGSLPPIAVMIGGNRADVADWMGTGAPGFTAPQGSTYRNRTGGAGTSFYVNETGTNVWAGK
jgi:hypothetical protein